MPKKHFVLLGLLISIGCMVVAAYYYPGGTQSDHATTGYRWTENYLTHLLGEKALNGMDNKGRHWAVASVLITSVTFGLFFIDFSEKIPIKGISVVIKYLGVLLTILAVFVVFPALHDMVINISSVITLLVFFYITVALFKSNLLWWKILSVLFLSFFYFACYLFFSGVCLRYMPLVQKLFHVCEYSWVLGLSYTTSKEDFKL